jgi:PAS domain S-box-containing protein
MHPSANYFDALFYNAKQNSVLVMDAEGTVLSINPSFIKCFGYSEKDILGKNGSMLFTKEDQQNEVFQKEVSTVLHHGQSFDNNYFVNKDQTITWVRGEAVLVKGTNNESFILKIIQDIHAQKRTEIALRNLNDFNESILRSIEDVVIVLDQNMNIVKTNSAFSSLFRYSVPEPSINMIELIKPYDKNEYLTTSINKALQTKTGFSNKQIELVISPTDIRSYDISCSFMDSFDGKNLLLIVHDITAYKELEKEKEDVMGFVAHELRNPLSNIILCNELMTEALHENDIALAESMLLKSKNNARRLQKMISELYESTKINSGYMQLQLTEFNFADAVKEAIDAVETLHPAFEIEVEGSSNVMITADRYRITQVLTNYLSNGIKYSNGKTRVTLAVSHDKKTLSVSVKDEGLGIPKEQLPFVFERFFRVEKTRNIEGIGLGLYLCRQIIHSHKGRLWVESEEGKGSIFYFSIPLVQ